MRTMRNFNWNASTQLTWSWPTLPAAQTPVFNPPVVVGQTVWIITDDGHVKKGRLLGETYVARPVCRGGQS